MKHYENLQIMRRTWTEYSITMAYTDTWL